MGKKEEIDSIYEPLETNTELPEKKKKWFFRWYMIIIYIILSLILIFFIALYFVEYGQCRRSCRLEICKYPNMSECLLDDGIYGKRKWSISRKKCICQAPKLGIKNLEINRLVKPTDTWEVDKNEVRYCGVPPDSNDGIGITYPSKKDMEDAGAIKLHKGPCGMCSNLDDKEAYNKTALTLTTISKKASYSSVFSAKIAKKKMGKANLTSKCVDCWVENMQQTIIHCFGKCIFGSRASCGKDGTLTPCLYCDEVHSGMYFRQCAGMTRRRAGIQTDICRKPGEIT